ncbi:bifunctional serine/threonine-protein kinase/formylglycine-generating enzyme family protein [Thermodesulfobacteriota bacterium]
MSEIIGDYELIGSLGKGGFGSVYKAKAASGNLVALKILNPQVLDNQKVVKKFFHEAMILAKLDHPNICRLIEFFPDGTNYAIVMEYVEGRELKDLMQEQENNLLPFDQAFLIAKQNLSAFQYAHVNGILHRDIKPANIMIDKQGNTKIMDFGIAKIAGAATHDTAASMLSIHYTPPERFDPSKTVDARSDVYALGLVFYELFAGRRPFDVDETSQIMFWHLNEIPEPVDTYVSGLPEEVVNAIETALEKDPDDRFQDFDEFSEAMGEGTPGVDYSAQLVDNELTTVDGAPASTSIIEPSTIKLKKKKKKKGKGMSGAMIGGIAAAAVIILALGGFTAYKMGWISTQPGVGTIITEEVVIPDIDEFDEALSPSLNTSEYVEIINQKDNSRMVHIPEGPFTMGSAEPDEAPEQLIGLDPYFIDKYPVTIEQFMKFVEETGHTTTAEEQGSGYVFLETGQETNPDATWRKPDGYISIEDKDDYLNHPVTQVSYSDAKAYCEWAGKELPTEAQWEKATRGNEKNIYPWAGDEAAPEKANYLDSWMEDTTPVTTYESGKSQYEVFDMAGNVYQWTKDWHAIGTREGENPTGPETGDERVLKGSSFIDNASSLRASSRRSEPEEKSSNIYGCRCAKPSDK